MPDPFFWLAPIYDRIFSPAGPEILSWLELQGGEVVLDIGGGTGRVAGALKEKARVVVVDLSPGMAVRAKKKGLMVCIARAEALPFPSEFADGIIVVDAFHHFRTHSLAAQEMMRVLKRGGRLFLEEPDISNLAVKLIALGEKLLLMRSRFYDFATLSSFFLIRGGNLLRFERKGGILRLLISRS
jgi:demethylmenaquinone methyltransferase/2-methoxy-6-polyprenyl-1,4-benzoquinol methylase